jgi:hypothetical protein
LAKLLLLLSSSSSLRCGACKRFAPTLALVSDAVRGRMAVGTVDCTVEEGLCRERFQISGYPTLMYAHYGRVEPSPLQHDRDVDDFLDFARRMSSPAVSIVQSMEEAHKFAIEQGVDGVAFVAYHPAAVSTTEPAKNIALLKTFHQASQRLHRYSSFAVLQPTLNEEGSPLLSEGPFICRLEDAVPTRCYDRISETLLIELDSLLDWVDRVRIPTVSRLIASGLEELGSKGRVLCLAVYFDPKDATDAERALKVFATTGAPELRDEYYFGVVDGAKHKMYLRHLGFEDSSSARPQIFLTSFSTKEYWQDATYGLDINRFLHDVKDGAIPRQSKRKNKARRKSLWTRLKQFFKDNRRWSYFLVIGLCVALFTLLQQFVKVRGSLRPPYPRSPFDTSWDGDTSAMPMMPKAKGATTTRVKQRTNAASTKSKQQ